MRIKPAKFVHVVYRTRRFAEMIAWYETVYDARIQYQNPALAFLTTMTNITASPSPISM